MAKNAGTWLEQSLDYAFKDARLLELALTHRSAQGDNNERLEFLGDAILDVVISAEIYAARPAATEGYRTAEVTLGGIDTRDVSSRTMESGTPGLFFVGEVLEDAVGLRARPSSR